MLSYIRTEREKQEYSIIASGYNNVNKNGNELNMSKIQEIFFDNLKQIFNSYNRYFESNIQEKKIKLNELDKIINDVNSLNLISN